MSDGSERQRRDGSRNTDLATLLQLHLDRIYEERLESRAARSPPAEATNGSAPHRRSTLNRNARKVK